MLQPDFGTGFIILVTIIGLLFVGGVNLKFFIYLFLIGLIGITGLIVVAPYRLKKNTLISKSMDGSIRKWVSNYSKFICNRTRWTFWIWIF